MIVYDFIYDTFIFWIILVTSIYIYVRIKESVRYPPGPFNIPFLGFVPFIIAKHPHEYLANLRKKYGGFFGFRVGIRYVFVISDYKTLKELINKEEFLYRPPIPPMSKFRKNSLTQSNGEIFKREKRLSMKILHKLAFEQKFLENVIMEEVAVLMKNFKEYVNIPCDVRYFLRRSTVNNIASLLFGKRLEHDDYRSRNLLEGVQSFEESDFVVDPTIFFPILKPILYTFGKAGYRKRLQWCTQLESVIIKEIEEHKAEEITEDSAIDYLEAYLLEIKKQNSFHSENALIGNSTALFIGGSVTTASFLEWFLIAMANHQDIQSRCFKEIKEVIGLEKTVEYSDMKVLPYVRAVMLEIYRWKTVVPLNLPRCLGKDVEYNGYILPKNAFVLVNIWAMHNDPEHWKKPNEFSPENFLDEEGNVINAEYCIPFCIGRRACPGESIANLEIFLYMVTMIQNYTFHSPDNRKLCTDGLSLLTHYSKPFKILIHSRQ